MALPSTVTLTLPALADRSKVSTRPWPKTLVVAVDFFFVDVRPLPVGECVVL